MITRLWRGWTATESADAYERFLLTELFPQMRAIPGFRGADVLRCAGEGEVAFVTLTRFDSLAAIRAFAGEDYETPVLEPTARALLSRSTRERSTSRRRPSRSDDVGETTFLTRAPTTARGLPAGGARLRPSHGHVHSTIVIFSKC